MILPVHGEFLNYEGILQTAGNLALRHIGNRRYIMQLWPKFPAQRSREFSQRTSTTLADLLTPLPAANPFSAMRASLRR
jgi:hypothetical protein